MNHSNPFSDEPVYQPKPKSGGAVVVVVVLAVIGGLGLLACGGLAAGVAWVVREVERDMDAMRGDLANNPFQTSDHMRRYYPLRRAGRYEEALVKLDEALAENPDNPLLHNEKSWMLATCPDENVRDGDLAVEHGVRACELSGWSQPAYVDTLAAAHAEAGDFEQAARRQQEAIDLDEFGQYEPGFKDRLDLYQAGQPYREGPPAVARPDVAPQLVEPADGETTERAPAEDVGAGLAR